MNVVFMCLGAFNSLEESSVHIDILKKFAEEHEVWLVCKNEDKPTALSVESGIHVLRVHTGKLKGTGLVRKGINTLLVEPQFKTAIAKYLADVKFDLVLYTTPPITFASAVKFLKNRNHAVTYLMLKDIFPQNAVDIGMMSKHGVKGLIYKNFRRKEKELYRWSDYIGCMSPANVDYVLKHNPEVPSNKVEVCPNISVIEDMSIDDSSRKEIRAKYGIPLDKKVFVYGGNLGKPQGIPFLIECLRECKDEDCFFLVIGQGTEYSKLKQFMDEEKPTNCMLLSELPKVDYEKLVAACDVGMIFLDYRFTIPNYPSRILSYMKAKVPVLACTDSNTDMGSIIENGEFGWWCESCDVMQFKKALQKALEANLSQMGENAFAFLLDNYAPEHAYEPIMKHFK